MARTEHSISSAARVVGLSRATILRHIRAGKLAATVDSDNRKRIDASELVRVYGDQCDFDESRGTGTKTPRSESELGSLVKQTQTLNDQLIAQYKSQVDDLREALNRAQEGLNRTTLLLEGNSKRDEIAEKRVSKLEEKLAMQVQETKRLRRALAAEKEKGLWRFFRS